VLLRAPRHPPDPRFDDSQEVNYWVAPSGTQRVYDLVPNGRLTMVSARRDELGAHHLRISRSSRCRRRDRRSALRDQHDVASVRPHPLAAVSTLESAHRILSYERDRIDIVEDGPIGADQARFEAESLSTLNAAR
jgi:hypothetical protein